MKKTNCIILTALVLLLALLWSTNASQTHRTPIRVLFLGDNGHHKPSDRFHQLDPVLKTRGIEMHYSDQLEELNPLTLAQFDALILYANHKDISESQKDALLKFVAAGGGFIPLHCASFCFQNSPEYIELVGAQFKSHGTGSFRTVIVDPTHRALEGVEEFETWDETYLHHQHNPDRHVLMVREEKGRLEPWTWVRTHGKGRIFYTAYGHDHRTWSHPSFRRLVENGIRWAAGDEREENLPERWKGFRYVDAVIPQYLPDQPGTSVEPLQKMQAPLAPEESLKHMRVPAGFDLKLYAAEPDIVKPVALAWDQRGRLWIAETLDYPNEKQLETKGRDRIKICEDTNDDGRADKFTVFADALNIPTSLVFANGGVIVSQAPDMLFLKDTNGDDRADVRQVLFTGWETWDTHAGPSNLRWGFDNWIWGTVGYSGFKGHAGGKYHEFRQGFFRFRPDGSELEFLGSTSNNTWGLGFSEEGFVFGSTANNQHSVYLAVPNRYYETVSGWSPARIPGIADHWRIHPLKENIRQVDWHGGFTAAAGHALYTARSFPKAFWNRVAFISEPTGSLLHNCVLIRQGSHFVSYDAKNMLASDDEWTAPVAAEVGPDGALWVIDWYNYIVQHNPTPHGFQTGKGNAFETPLRDKQHGRIYRIVYPKAPSAKRLNLEGASTETLVATLAHENLFWRLTAQRLLCERGPKDVAASLVDLVRDQRVDEMGLNVGAIHALWTMHGLGVLDSSDAGKDSIAQEALHHPSAGVRRTALHVLASDRRSSDAILKSGVLQDSDAQVRLSALLALSRTASSEEIGRTLVSLLNAPNNLYDRWIPDAIIIAAARHSTAFLKSVVAGWQPPASTTGSAQSNLIPNSSFEQGLADWPLGWGFRVLKGQSDHRVEQFARTGRRSVMISSTQGGNARWSSSVEVKPHTQYLLRGWIKTRDLESPDGSGALLQAQGVSQNGSTPAVAKTSDWTLVETTFNTGALTRLTITCLFGGAALAKGQAWFDEIDLQEVEGNPDDRMARVVRIVATHYAHTAPNDSVISLLNGFRAADAVLLEALLDGLAAGWPAGRGPDLTAADRAELTVWMRQLKPELKDRLLILGRRWGRTDLFPDEAAAILQGLRDQVANATLSPEQRIGAAQRLLLIADNREAILQVVEQITPQASSRLVTGLLESLSKSASTEVAIALINRWDQMTPAIRQSAISLLMRRSSWTQQLLAAVQSDKIDYREFSAEQVQRLSTHPNPAIAQSAKKLASSGGRLFSSDRQAVIQRLLPVVNRPGNAKRGKLVFEKDCSRCHTFNGVGKNIGPDLSGMGSRSRPDLLVDLLDPSRSVEGNYRLWMITTTDGEMLTGRLENESETAVELLDGEGQKHLIHRKNIEEIRASRLSMMPDGLEEHISPEDLSALLEYLTRKEGGK